VAYVPFREAIASLNINPGDIILVSSDVIRLIRTIQINEGPCDISQIINALQDIVGDNGTLLFPTFNWDFCQGLPFDYYKTPSMTGALSGVALQRKDFKRTKHPIYSFAVWGKYQDYLYSLENTDSFGPGSPFDFLYKQHGKNLIIDVDYQNCFTFLHYVEESVGITYRYIKNFISVYIDEYSEKKEKTYSMYVRDLTLEAENNINPMGEVLEKMGIADKKSFNKIPFILIDLHQAYDAIKDDIVHNRSRKVAVFNGQ
jgi:aminoglycoside 3-N-acetyltransferase